MAFLFGRNKQKGIIDVCRTTKDLLQRLELNVDAKLQPRLEEDTARNLSQMKMILMGTQDVEPNPEQAAALVQTLMSEDVLYPLTKNMQRLPFESRKDAQSIFSNVLRFKGPQTASSSDQPPALSYVVNQRLEIIAALCHGYDWRESAMFCGGILREALKHDSVAALILYDEPTENGRPRALGSIDPNVQSSGKGVFWKFFDWIDKGSFEVSADAFNTFSAILTTHKKLVSHFLVTNQAQFEQPYNKILIQSSSYVTKRRSLNLLSTLLLERTNYAIMMRYIASAANLKLIMQLLRHDGRMVNYEAFHVFKIFTANPHKTVEVQKILINNKQKLLAFLPDFLSDRTEDVQFNDEKAYLIRTIEQLPSQPIPPIGEEENGGNNFKRDDNDHQQQQSGIESSFVSGKNTGRPLAV